MSDYSDQEHYEGEDKSQASITSITGTSQPPTPGMEREVEAYAQAREDTMEADRQTRRALSQVDKKVIGVIQRSAEAVCRTIIIPSGQAYQLFAENFYRRRAHIRIVAVVNVSPNYLAVGLDPSVITDANGNNSFNSILLIHGVPDLSFIDLNTVRDIWAYAPAQLTISTIEEFG